MSGFLAGISVLCFAASYTVSFLLELSRLLFRSGVRGAVMIGFALAGLFAHVLFLGYRGYQAVALSPVSYSPLSSAFDWYLLAALALVCLYLYLTAYHPRTPIGLFLLPAVLSLIAVAQFLANDKPFARDFASQVWGMVHGVFWLVGIVAVIIGFAAGVMYLVQANRLKHNRQAHRGLQLPSLEWLEKLNSRAIVVTVFGVALGIGSGLILNLINHQKRVDELPWNDPVVWSSGLVTLWVLVVAVFNAVYKPAQRGQKVAYLTVATGLVVACHLALSLSVPTQHGQSRPSQARSSFPRSAWERTLGRSASKVVPERFLGSSVARASFEVAISSWTPWTRSVRNLRSHAERGNENEPGDTNPTRKRGMMHCLACASG